MGYIIKMPKLGLEMEEGIVLEWYVDSGDEVAEGDTLVEVESEKSIGEVDARADGSLRHRYIEADESVPPGTPIGILAASDADIGDLKAEAEAELESTEPAASAESEPTDEPAGTTATTAASDAEVDKSSESAAGSTADTRSDEQKVSPRARKRAEELGVDLGTVDGTGFDGAVTEEDVEAAAESEPPTTEGIETDLGVAAEERLDRYRRTTAVADPSASEALFETMEAVRTAFEERVTMTDVLVVVASAALRDHPVLNGTYAESTHHVRETQNIALLVDGELRQAVIEDAERRSLTEIIETRQQAGGSEAETTFTLANAAETGAERRLVNPPAVAALTIDATGQRAVPADGGVDLQSLVRTSLTYDARAVGENEARTFLDAFFERAKKSPELVLGSYRGTE